MWTFITVTAHCNDVLYVCGHLGNMMRIIHVIPDLAKLYSHQYSKLYPPSKEYMPQLSFLHTIII